MDITSYMNKLPHYETVTGIVLPIDENIQHEFQLCIQNTTIEECRSYAKALESAGFTQYSAKEITVGTQEKDKVNLYFVYTRKDMHVFLTWNGCLSTTRIVVALPQALPGKEKAELKEAICTPSITQPKLVMGMSYVIQLADGSFIVMDGGLYNAEDAQYLYEFLAEKTPKGQQITITAWMFSHPHIDHIELATYFIQKYAADVIIQSFLYQFPDCGRLGKLYEGDERVKDDVALLEERIASCYPYATVYTLHTGQTYFFNGAEIDIIFTAEDIYPHKPDSYNDLSAAWRVKFNNGTTFLVLGDCFSFSCQEMANIYGNYVKSDILQVAHHGLIGGNKELYQLVDPQVCFWATSEKRFVGNFPYEKFHYCLGEGGCDYNAWIRDPSIRVREHYHSSVTTVLIMD